jgi:rubrerythrin
VRRRDLLGGALAGIAAGPLGAPDLASAAEPVGVHAALQLELLIVFVYRRLLDIGTLASSTAKLAATVLGHEQTHVEVLSALARRLGQPVPAPPATVAQADRQLSRHNASGRLAAVRSEGDALRLLYDVESIAIGTYYEALHTLTDPVVIRSAAEIMAAEAQHASALGGVLHPGKWVRVDPVASVEGKH